MVDCRELWPPGGGPKYTHASKERRGRQKERRTKKERVRHVEKGTKGFEHASGQRPGEFLMFSRLGAMPERLFGANNSIQHD